MQKQLVPLQFGAQRQPRAAFSRYRTGVIALLTVALALTGVGLAGAPAHAADPLLSQGKTATASSIENAGTPASAAFDGNTGTRWSSAASDPQWLQVDLGTSQTLCGATINWETAYGTAYNIQVSPDGTTWTLIYSTTTGKGGTETLTLTGTGRYVRLTGTTRATGYGYSIWELTLNTTTGGTGGGTPLPTSDNPDFGPSVAIFDPTMSQTSIQAKLDSVFNAQKLQTTCLDWCGF